MEQNFFKEEITKELEKNNVFKIIFDKFEIPNLDVLDKKLDLVYKSNEYMCYYSREIYFDLVSKENTNNSGTLKLTFTSNVKEFDIKKAMHLVQTSETHIVSVTFVIYDKKDDWDSARYNYTLWKNNKETRKC